MDLDEIKKIIELMDEHELSCFQLEEGDKKIKLKKGANLEALGEALAAANNHAPAAAPPPAGAAAEAAAGEPQA
ncbi:MAG: acetyl-CoA carboxylase, biotin carboxyl carrier protein, partial [Verrucomicrobiales bacterium]